MVVYLTITHHFYLTDENQFSEKIVQKIGKFLPDLLAWLRIAFNAKKA